MSSMGKAPRIAAPLAFGTLALLGIQSSALSQDSAQAPVLAPATPPATPPATVQDWQAARGRITDAVQSDYAVQSTIAEWRRLQQSDGYGFSAYANFITANPGWPSEDHFRDVAERAVNPAYDVGQAISFFTRFPPRTATGHARYAFALSSSGRTEEARAEARRAWTEGTLSIDDEQRILSLFVGSLTPEDHLRHADCALWANDPSAAERILGWLPPTRRPIIEARIAMQRRSPDAPQRMAAADPIGVQDAGYIADKSRWMFSNNDWLGARNMLGSRGPVTTPPGNPERWYEYLLSNARNAANDGQYQLAYNIASKVDDAYPSGTDISAQPYGVRDDYTSLTWLAGSAALNKLGRPSEAVEMFTRYAAGSKMPQVVSKGYYWAGRAAAKAGRAEEANNYFRKASAYPDQYYGQLALERLGLPVPVPSSEDRLVVVSPAERTAFANRSVVRAARYLGATGQWMDQSKVLRAIAANASTAQDHALAAELSRSLSRPDLGVMVGRRALANGLSGYGDASFPRVSVPDDHAFNWTMIHAIARQESQFDRQIVSRAGARGLMQLMPRTAEQIAGKIGLGYDSSSLYDTQYNIRIGSTYFRQMLDYYGGSYPLAIAAYNAGPGNVNKWLAANGDPRQGGDVVQWIENIPISETRNYVQRVLENAVVYDLLNPRNSGLRIGSPLSRYLGKNQPG
jgi:soluble lytic murein transglycosylase